MPPSNAPSAATRKVIAALARPPRIEECGPIAGRFVHALRLIALHDRVGRDPVPELAVRLGSVAIAAKALMLAQAISSVWPEDIHVSRFCCRLLSHDEATIAAFIEAAAAGDRRGFEAALSGLLRHDRMPRLWEGALALTEAEIRAL